MRLVRSRRLGNWEVTSRRDSQAEGAPPSDPYRGQHRRWCPKHPPSMLGASYEQQCKLARQTPRYPSCPGALGEEWGRTADWASRASNKVPHDSLRPMNLTQLTHLSGEGNGPDSRLKSPFGISLRQDCVTISSDATHCVKLIQ